MKNTRLILQLKADNRDFERYSTIQKMINHIRKRHGKDVLGCVNVDKGDKIKDVLDLIMKYGGIDDSHHKQWLLNEIVEILSDDYDKWVEDYNGGEDGPNTYEWDRGIAP